jgi:hypothetical protein
MYSLLTNEPLRKQLAAQGRAILAAQTLTLIPALLIAQLFYHWKSFLLEFVGFLATWFVLDLAASLLRNVWAKLSARAQ